jgi:hypothetical protein
MAGTGRRVGGWEPVELAIFVGGIAAYTALLLVGRTMVTDGDPTTGQRWFFATGTIVAALLSVGVAIRRARRTDELDRLIVSESTSLAFFATMLAVLTYGLLESFIDAPRLTAWNTWMFGMSSWIVLTFVFRRKLT